jgi:hypothetical protein
MSKLHCKIYFQNFTLLIIWILILIFITEGIFRLFIYLKFIKYPNIKEDEITYRYSGNKDLIYELKPNFSSVDGMYQTNKYGMRDYKYSLTKLSNVIRICVLGDSVAFGYDLVTVEQTFEKLLEVKLNNKSKIIKFEILNFSVPGYNSYQEEITLKEKVIKFKPDIILVGFCLNDDTYTDGYDELARELSPYSIGSKLHSKLISYILYLCEINLFEKLKDMDKVEHFFQQLSILSKEKHFDLIVLIFPFYFENIELYKYKEKHIKVYNLAKKNGLKVIDFMDIWKDMDYREREELYLFKDPMHFSFAGMKEIADKLFNYFVITYNLEKK